MSKRKTKLIIGKFYHAYGGNRHPAQVYEKTDKGTYKSIKTGTSDNGEMIEIKPIQKGYSKSYIQIRPFEGSRLDYGDRELQGLAFDPTDYEKIEAIKKRRPKLTRRAKQNYKK